MKSLHYIKLLILVSILLSSCGTSYVLVQYPDAELYKNGKFIGKNVGEIPRYGLPGKAQIEARVQNKVIGTCEVRRTINESALLVGLFTYGTGFFFSFSYPGCVLVPLNQDAINRLTNKDKAKPSWDNEFNSKW